MTKYRLAFRLKPKRTNVFQKPHVPETNYSPAFLTLDEAEAIAKELDGEGAEVWVEKGERNEE